MQKDTNQEETIARKRRRMIRFSTPETLPSADK
jgi:hypothetical protein